MMITEDDKKWLSTYYPSLSINAEGTEVTGILEFKASYDSESNSFTPLSEPGQTADGVVIEDSYQITITEPKDEFSIPSLRVEGDKVPHIIDRHFYDSGNACLCGPVEEYEFVKSGFSFPKYLERLVIPFLYEQSYYDLHKTWPWGEYGHGVIGILQSFYNSAGTADHAKASLRKLKANSAWSRIQAILSGREPLRETSPCLCSKHKQIRNCSPVLWYSILKLQRVIRENNISLNK